MNIKKIYLIRHGQTDLNRQGIVQGSGVDSSLNDLGRAQALGFFEQYKHISFDKVYTSALKRTHESVAPFLDRGLSHQALAELNEISWGVREGIPVDEEADRFYNGMIESWRNGDTTVKIEGGESPDEVYQRLKKGLGEIMSRRDEENVLVCMHGRAMRVMLCLMLNYPLRAMDLFEHQNLCLYQLNHTGSMYVINKFNNTDHLTL